MQHSFRVQTNLSLLLQVKPYTAAASYSCTLTVTYGVASPSITSSVTFTPSISGTASRSSSITASPSVSSSNTASPTTTLTLTATASPLTQKFSAVSLIVLRVGTGSVDAVFTAGNQATRVYLDEIYIDGTLIQSIDTGCYLTAGAMGDGILSFNSLPGGVSVVAFACYETSNGVVTPYLTPSSVIYRRIGLLQGDASIVNASRSTGIPTGAVKSVIVDGNSALVTLGSEGAMAGLYNIPLGPTTSAMWNVVSELRGTGSYGQVFWNASQVYYAGSSLSAPAGISVFSDTSSGVVPGESSNPSLVLDYNSIVHETSQYPTIYGAYVESATRVWTIDSRAAASQKGLFRSDYSVSNGQWAETSYAIPCSYLGYQGYALIGRVEPGVGLVLYFTTYKAQAGTRLYRFLTTVETFALIRHSASGLMYYKSVAFPPGNPIFATPTSTGTPSVTSSPAAAAFRPGNVLVVRMGDPYGGTGLLATAASPVFIDEVDVSTGARLQTVTTAGALHGLNPLASYEGQLYASSDGSTVSFAAYTATTGTAITLTSPQIAVTVGVTRATTVTTLQTSSNRVRGAVVESGGVLAYGSGGSPMWNPAASTGSAALYANASTSFQPNFVLAYGGSLYCTFPSMDTKKIGVYACGKVNQGVGIEPAPFIRVPIDDTLFNPTALTFQDSNTLWVTDESSSKTVMVYCWDRDDTTNLWFQTAAVFVTNSRSSVVANPAVYGMTSDQVGSHYILYVSTPVAIFSINTTTLRVATLLRADTGAEFRGLALAPTTASRTLATPTSSRTATVAQSIAPSVSPAAANAIVTSRFDSSALAILRVERNVTNGVNNYYASLIQVNSQSGLITGDTYYMDVNSTRGYNDTEKGCRFTGPYTYGDSQLLLSGNGAMLTVPCYRSSRMPAVNTPWLFNAARWVVGGAALNTYRLVARILSNGTVDFSTQITSGWNSTYVVGAATQDGSAYFVATKGISVWQPDASLVNYMNHGSLLNQNLTIYKAAPTTQVADIAVYGVKMYGGRLFVSVSENEFRGLLRYPIGYFYSAVKPEYYLDLVSISSSGFQQRLTSWEHQDDWNIWALDATRSGTLSSIFQYTLSSTTGIWTESRALAMPDGVRAASMTARQEAEWCVYVVSYTGTSPSITNKMWRYSATVQKWELLHSATGDYHYKSIALTPRNFTISTPSITPSASASPKSRKYASNNVIVLQLGDGSTVSSAATYTAQLVEVDVNTGYTYNPVQATSECGLPAQAILNAGEGQLQRSIDGRFVTFVCYKSAQKVALNASTISSVAVLEADGTLTATTDLSASAAAIGALTDYGNEIWVAYADGVNGIRLHQRNQGWSSSVKLNAEGSLTLRSLAYGVAADGSMILYATVNASSNYVTAQLNGPRLKSPGSSFQSLYGMQSFSAPLRNPFTFVFQNSTLLWVADPRYPASGSVWKWSYQASTGMWQESSPIFVSPYPIMYLTGWWVGPTFVMYATTSGTAKSILYQIDVVTQTSTILSVAPRNYVYRGVARVPDGNSTGAFLAPTPTASGAATPTPAVTQPLTGYAQKLLNTSILALGSCSDAIGQTYTYSKTSKVCVYEITPAGVLRRVLVAPTNCTLASTYLEDGIMSLSADGMSVVFGCYSAAVNTANVWLTSATTVPRVAASIAIDGTISTAAINTAALSQQPLRSVAAQSATSSIAFAGGWDNSTQGLLLAPAGTTASVQQLSPNPVQNYAMHYANGLLYVLSRSTGWLGILSYGKRNVALSINADVSPVLSLEAMKTYGGGSVRLQPRDFHIDPTDSIWLLDSRAVASGERLYLYAINPDTSAFVESGRWVMPDGQEPYGITGRWDTGTYTLYIATVAVNTGSKIFAFDTSAMEFRIAPFYSSSSASILLKSVCIPPFDQRAPAVASASATSTARPQLFETGNLIVSRQIISAASTVSQDIYLDEVSTVAGGSVLSTAAVSDLLPSGYYCTLPSSRTASQEGAGTLSLSADGRNILLSCFGIAAGQSTPAVKQVVAIDASRNLRRIINLFDDSDDAPLGTAGAVDAAGNMQFWTASKSHNAMYSYGPDEGVTQELTDVPLRYITLYNSTLYGSMASSVVQVGQGLAQNVSEVFPLPGMSDGVVRSPWGFWFESYDSLWVADNRASARNLYRWKLSPVTGTWAEVSAYSIGAGDVQSVSTSKPSIWVVTGQTLSSGLTIYCASYDYVYAFNPATGRSIEVYDSPGYTIRGITLTPYEAERVQKSPSATAAYSSTTQPTPSITVAASAIRSVNSSESVTSTASSSPAAALFLADSIIVLRVGDGTLSLTDSSAAVVALEEYAQPNFVLRQTRTLPISALGANKRCTLPGAAMSNTSLRLDGQLSLSPDGTSLTLACYDAPLKGTVGSSMYARVVATVRSDGVVDSSTTMTDLANGTVVRGAVRIDGTGYFLSTNAAGVRYVSAGGNVSSAVVNIPSSINSLTLTRGTLYASTTNDTVSQPLISQTGILQIGAVGGASALPAALSPQTISMELPLHLMTIDGWRANPQSFCWEDSTHLWLLDKRSGTTNSLFSYELSSPTWLWVEAEAYTVPSGSIPLSLACRSEAGQFIMYIVSFNSAGSTLYQFNSASMAWTALAQTTTKKMFKGVALPPVRIPTSTPTASNTPTPSQTPSVTQTPSNTASNTATPSVTASQTGTGTASNTITQTPSETQTSTPSETASQTASPSVTASQTGTQTASQTASTSVTPSQTSSQSKSSTWTSSSTRTAAVTSSPSVSASVTPVPPSLTPSPSITASNTASSSTTPSHTASGTASNTASSSASQTISPSVTASITASNTQSPSDTQTGTSTMSATVTASNSKSSSQTASQTVTSTVTQTPTFTRTGTRTHTRSGTVSATSTSSRTASKTVTHTSSQTRSTTASSTGTPSETGTASSTVTGTSTQSPTPTPSPTATQTSTGTETQTGTSSETPTQTPTQSETASNTQTSSSSGKW
jgi:hypothetical protein